MKYQYTNPVENNVINKLDEGKEEAIKLWKVTNLPNHLADVHFASKAYALLYASKFKKEHNLSNPIVEKI